LLCSNATCTATLSALPRNESIIVFGSNRNIATPYGADTGLDVRNAIMWQEDADNRGSFFYYDCYAVGRRTLNVDP
jgi:hypothetical protein